MCQTIPAAIVSPTVRAAEIAVRTASVAREDAHALYYALVAEHDVLDPTGGDEPTPASGRLARLCDQAREAWYDACTALHYAEAALAEVRLTDR
jgi:hypothetical protein